MGGGRYRQRPSVRAARALAVLSVIALLVGACSGHADRAGKPSPLGSQSSTQTAHVEDPAQLQITPARGSRNVRPGQPITVAALGGTLQSVSVRSGSHRVGGVYDGQRRSWQSTGTLHVSSWYTVNAEAINAAGAVVRATASFRTLVPASTFTADVSEQEGATYGVGMPIQVTFSQPIVNKAGVERALQLRTSKPVVGAWYWLDDQHVNFRPRDYWPAHTKVSFTARLNGVRAAPGVYGTADVSRRFRIGASVVVVASTATHRMRVYVEGKRRFDWPISTGRPGYDTANGTYLTIEKGNPVRMRPAGIAPGQPGYYDLWVPWSVRITWDGVYLHDAWWSVGEQGWLNVSHGCVNMPPAAAELYYKMEVPGDPVTITDSPVAGSVGDGWTDWFYSWREVLHRSALHRAVQAGPHGSAFVVPTAVPASAAKAPTGRPVSNNAAAS